MKNFIADGYSLQMTAPVGGIVGGSVVKLGSLVVVAVSTVAEGEQVTGMLRGVYSDLPKVAGTAFLQGDGLYWDDTAKNLTKTASGNTFAGYAYAAALAADTLCTVLLSR